MRSMGRVLHRYICRWRKPESFDGGDGRERRCTTFTRLVEPVFKVAVRKMAELSADAAASGTI